MAIPINITQLPKSLQPKPEAAPPMSEEELKVLLLNGLGSIVQTEIERHKLPYTIVDGKLTDCLKGSALHLKRFITVDPDTVAMKETVQPLAKCPDEVLVHGETGTGKELIARAMIGDRVGKFVAINCAGLPSELIESELFGHVKGSFTGADGTKQGLLKSADDGVAFLDEVGELPLAMQAKLLRVIQERRIRRVGSNLEEDINCKFVFATNRNLPSMVSAGQFRQDLYARLSTLELYIKPLRERTCDIEPIIESMPKGKDFLTECTKQQINPRKELDLQHNVRSLYQYVRRFAILGSVKVISTRI